MSDNSLRPARSHPKDLEPGLPMPELEAEGVFDIREKVVCGIWRSKWLVLALLLVGTAAGLLSAASQPNTYTSSARLRLRLGRVETFSMEEMLGAEVDRPSYFSTTDEIFLLQDPEIYLNVARSVGPRDIMIPPDPTQYDNERTFPALGLLHRLQKIVFESKIKLHCQTDGCETCILNAAEYLQARTTLVPERSSSVISLHYEGYSPQAAQRIAQALVHASVDRHRKEFTVSKYVGINKENLEEAYKSLLKAKDEYEAHRKDCGFVDIVVQRENLLTATNQLQMDLRKDTASLRGVQAQLEQLRLEEKQTAKTSDRKIPKEVAQNEEYIAWKETLINLRIAKGNIYKQTEKTKEFIESEERIYDERIKEAEAELASLEDKKIIVTIPEQIYEVPNETYLRIRDRLIDHEADEKRLMALLVSAEESLKDTNEEFARLLTCEKTHQYWDLEIENQQRAYSKLSEKNAEVESLALLDVQPEGNLSELQKATLPARKDGPRRSKFVLMGVFGGAALGLALALARQLLDRSLRYPVSIERDLGLSLLGVVPELRELRGATQRRHVA